MIHPDAARLRARFPALRQEIRGKAPIYMDSACTTLRPEPVIQAMADFQRRHASCHGRADHFFGRETSRRYQEAREAVGAFIGAERASEIIFVRNTTEAVNLVATCAPLAPDDTVLTTNIEHNSNLLPWQRLARTRGVHHRIHHIDVRRGFDLAAFRRDVVGAKLVALLHVSNLCGVTLPLAEICAAAHRAGAWVLVDAAQSVATHRIDVRALGVDFLAFSFHKMFGPAGIGVLYGRQEMLSRLPPFHVGGDTVDDVRYREAAFSAPPERFEAGVANYEGAVGAAAAVRFVEEIGQQRLLDHVTALNRRATEGLTELGKIRLVGPADPALRGGILTFYVDGLSSVSLAKLLDTRENIMVRYGKHCVHAWFHEQGVPDTVRASLSIYNTEAEVDRLVRTVSAGVRMLDL